MRNMKKQIRIGRAQMKKGDALILSEIIQLYQLANATSDPMWYMMGSAYYAGYAAGIRAKQTPGTICK